MTGAVPSLPTPSPEPGSGRSWSTGATRHSVQPPLIRNRTAIWGVRPAARQVKPTIVTSDVSSSGVSHSPGPLDSRPRSRRLFSSSPTPDLASACSCSRPPWPPSLGVEGAHHPRAGPGHDPGSEDGHGGSAQHLSSSGP